MVGTGELEAKLLNIQIDRKTNVISSKICKSWDLSLCGQTKITDFQSKEELDEVFLSPKMIRSLEI